MFSSVRFSCSIASDSLRPHESQHARSPCPSPTPGVHSDPRTSSQWCHPAISSSVVPFSSCPQSLPASESFPMTQLFAWGSQSTGVSASASFLPKNTQGWSPSEWTGNDVSVTLINPLWTFLVVVVIQSLSPFWLCNPMDCSLPGSFVHGISQAKIQDWVAISSSRGASQPRDRTHVSCTGRWILYHWSTWEVVKTPCSHCRVHSFHPWSRKIPHSAWPNNNINKVIFYKALICGTVPEWAHI